jgi:hypothetical protein
MKDTKKQKFFDKLHEKLALKYNVNLLYINSTRSFILGRGFSKDKLREWALFQTTLPSYSKGKSRTDTRKRQKQYYFEFAEFLKTVTDKQLDDILQLTKFDKKDKKKSLSGKVKYKPANY